MIIASMLITIGFTKRPIFLYIDRAIRYIAYVIQRYEKVRYRIIP